MNTKVALIKKLTGNVKQVMEYDLSVLKDENEFYEWIYPNKPMRPYIDLDGKKINMFKYDKDFRDKNNEILKALSCIPNTYILSSSNPQYIPKDDGECKGKFSYRLTFSNVVVENMKDCKLYIENVAYPFLINALQGVYDLAEYGKSGYNMLDVDTSVYRGGSGGKMRTVNSKKSSENGFGHTMRSGGKIEDYLIHNLNGSEEQYKPINKEEKKQKKRKIMETPNMTLHENLSNTVITENMNQATEPTNTDITENLNQATEMFEIADNIAIDPYLDDYNYWIKIVWSCASIENYDLALYLSKKSYKFNEEAKEVMDDLYHKYKTENGCTKATLYYFSNKSNGKAFKEIKRKYNQVNITYDNLTGGAIKIAEVLTYELRDNVKYYENEKQWFLYDEKTKMWIVTQTKPVYLFVKKAQSIITNQINNLLQQLNETSNDEGRKTINNKIKELANLNTKVDTPSYCSQLIQHLQHLLLDNSFADKMDNHIGKIAFKNGMFDLTTNSFSEGFCQYDYISKTLDYDYGTSNVEEEEFVKKAFMKINNNDEECFNRTFSVLGYSLLGFSDIVDKLWAFTGGGGNGKTLLLSTLEEILPLYVKNVNAECIVAGSDKKHKYIIETKGFRICYIEEFPKKRIDREIIKQWVDGKYFDVEKMYGTSLKMKITNKLFVLTNHSLKYDDCGGVQRRLQIHDYNAKFDEQYTEEDYDNLNFPKDSTLEKKLRTTYKNAVLKLLFDFAYRFIQKGGEINSLEPIPKMWKESTYDTIDDNKNKSFSKFFEANFNVDAKTRISKDELKNRINLIDDDKISFKYVKNELTKIGYKYDYNKSKGSDRGVWVGIELKPYEFENDE